MLILQTVHAMEEDTFLVKFSRHANISMSRITIEMVPLAFRPITAPLASHINNYMVGG